jgi:thiol-disulfide isomerase/thioredoxin
MFNLAPRVAVPALGVAVAAVFSVAALTGGCRGGGRSALPDTTTTGRATPSPAAGAVPDFTLPDLSGTAVRLSDYRGKVVLLDFWATWCGPCRMEIPHFLELTSKYGERGFVVVGVAMDETGAEVVRPFVEKYRITYPIVLGDAYTANRFGGVSALPTTLLLDREGRQVRKYVGYRDLKVFEQDIAPLL